MNRRSYLIATVSAEIRAKTVILRFEKEFGNGNQNQRRDSAQTGQTNNAAGVVPNNAAPTSQQPVYGG
jgi:hypothetical protein